MLSKIKKIVRYKFLLPSIYLLTTKKRIKNKLVLYSIEYDYLEPSFFQLYKALKSDGRYSLTVINKVHGFSEEVKLIKEIRNARFIFICSGSTLLDNIPLRKETKIINLWHGCGAFKKFGLSKMKGWGDIKDPFNKFKNTNLFTVTSEEIKEHYSEATGIPLEKGVIRALGSSRTDIFFDKNFLHECDEKKKSFLSEHGAENKKILLYAPTFRGKKLSESYTPDFLDLRKLKMNLEDNFILLLKRHPITKKRGLEIPDELKSFCIDAGDFFSISELIVISDILISDYSSLIFEWCLFEKPLYFLVPDLDEYIDERGFYFDFKSLIMESRLDTTDDLIRAVKDAGNFDFDFIHKLRKGHMAACDGKSTRRIIAELDNL